MRAKVRLIAGIDEAGRGPLAGPVFAAAVMSVQDIEHGFDPRVSQQPIASIPRFHIRNSNQCLQVCHFSSPSLPGGPFGAM